MTLFDRIGADALRAALADFYDRVFADVMIGFMFQGKDKRRLIDKEWELAAAVLGGGVKYSGRPMRAAHAQHTIFGGQFERRLQILREALRDHHVDPEVVAALVAHAESLRSQITRDRGSECQDTGEADKLVLAKPAQDPDKPVKLGRR